MKEPKVTASELYYASVLGAIYGYLFSLIVPNWPPVTWTTIPLVNRAIGLVVGLAVFLAITLFTIHNAVKFLRYAFRWWFARLEFEWRWPPVHVTPAKED
jgi:hypothetical protein